ncbi:MAG: hypothetical protein ACRC4N_04135, partial [Gammaproteobacteria bacterium]
YELIHGSSMSPKRIQLTSLYVQKVLIPPSSVYLSSHTVLGPEAGTVTLGLPLYSFHTCPRGEFKQICKYEGLTFMFSESETFLLDHNPKSV